MYKIKLLRKQKNLTQVELAKKSGVDRGYLSKIENGEGNPTYDTLQKIAAALDCKVGDLID